MLYVADTHALVWHLTNSDKLSTKVKKIFKAAEDGENNIVIPVIVLAEIVNIVEKKKAQIEFKKVIEAISVSESYIVDPLDLRLITMLFDLAVVKEIHDRIIVATARFYNAPLLTKDSMIVASKLVETIW